MSQELIEAIYKHQQKEKEELIGRLDNLQESLNQTDNKISLLFKQINVLSITDVVNNLKWEDMNLRTCPYPKVRKTKGLYYKYDINIPWYKRRGQTGENYFRVFIHGHDVKKVNINCPNYREEMLNKMKETCYKKVDKI